ncbi:hypothetical protein L208DRAFT_1382990 [Tricholoma matsutake]|nr:hypothetical protein L208DRAFT_1382990 [Tricholoma matsutake 945]
MSHSGAREHFVPVLPYFIESVVSLLSRIQLISHETSVMDSDDIPIDPILLPCVAATPLSVQTVLNQPSTLLPTLQPVPRVVGSNSAGEVLVTPQRDEHGQLTLSGYAFRESLEDIKRKKPLQDALTTRNVSYPKSANLEQLRDRLAQFWYPGFVDEPQSDYLPSTNTIDAHPRPIHRLARILGQISVDDNEEISLVEFDVDGADAGENTDAEGLGASRRKGFGAFQQRVRVTAAKSEGNRRAGGLKMQRAMVKAWESQLKKLFFGALRIHKERDAENPSLAHKCPVTSVIVWDAIKNWMDEALERVRSGLVPAEDVPNIIANTFLAEVTQEQLDAIGLGFLQRCELRSVVNGHLTWTVQNATVSIGRESVPPTGSESADGEAHANDATVHGSTFSHSGIFYTNIFSSSQTVLYSLQLKSMDAVLSPILMTMVYMKWRTQLFVPTTPRARSQVDLVLPPAAAFTKPGQINLLWPPVLGQKSVHWDQVFAPVKQPELLWDCWKPLKSLDQFNLEELWACYSLGEPVFNADGVQTGIKPPLQLVEKYFQSKWRGRSDHKQWEHFHELPEWILSEAATRVTSPLVIIEELANICNTATGNKMGLNVLSNHVKKLHFANAHS